MTIIKEVLRYDHTKDQNPVSPYGTKVIIRTNTYASTFAHFQMLFDEVKKDFPTLIPESANIVHYGGRHYKGTYGIEFKINEFEIPVPAEYKEVSSVEFAL
jgi:hypothetical protein